MELLILEILIICLVACVVYALLIMFVECAKEVCKRIRYKRAKVVPLTTAKETSLPTDCYVVDVRVHPVTELQR